MESQRSAGGQLSQPSEVNNSTNGSVRGPLTPWQADGAPHAAVANASPTATMAAAGRQ